MVDHDQRFKVLLTEFLSEFFELFLPRWHRLFDFSQVEFLTNEAFVDPTKGEKVEMDLVAKLRLLNGEPDRLAIIHIEIESPETMVPIGKRLADFYFLLRKRYNCNVLPVVLFLFVGGEGIGVNLYSEELDNFEILTFRYPYIGLPALDSTEYRDQSSLLGSALSVLMKQKRSDRPINTALVVKRLVESKLNDQRRDLLLDCALAYGPLDAAQQQETDSLIANVIGGDMAQYELFAEWKEFLREQALQNARQQVATEIRQQVEQEVRQEVRQEGHVEMLSKLLSSRFGPLPPTTQEQLHSMSVEALESLGVALLKASSLKELGLSDN